jgi:arylsulfatase A-like enzyme
MMTPVEGLPTPTFLRKVLVSVLGYTVFFYLFFLIFNTSFSFMGVDIGDYLKQYLGAFFGVYLKATFLVFASSFVFHAFVGILFTFGILCYQYPSNRLTEKPKSIQFINRYLFLYLFLIDILGFCHSVILYPQIYGEFFFYRNTWAVNILYFLTDHFSPILFSSILLILFSFQLGTIFTYFWKYKNKQSLFFIMHSLLILLLFQFGLLYLSLVYIVFLPILMSQIDKIHIKSYVILIPLLVLLFPFPYLADSLYGFFSPSDKTRPPIFLISADSLRYDKLGFVSGNSEITPHIDQFAKDSFVFHDHHTTIPRTFPSWADLLTGQYSMSHKIRDMFPSKEEQKRIGIPPFTTIPQFLKPLGYKSYGIGSFAADIFPRADFGFDETLAPNFNARIMTIQRTAESQLFLLPVLTGSFFGGGFFINEMDGLSTWGDGARLVDRIKKVIRKSGDSSYFVTYFSSVVHFPYSPAYPKYKKFTDPNYYGKYKYLKFVDPSVSEKPSEREVSQIRNLFDSSVFAFDSEFGEIIQYLKEKGIYDHAMIIVTADHGEALYEDIHGQGHGEHLRGEAVTKVPLLIKFPKNSAWNEKTERNYTGVTSSIDLYPTIAGFFNIQEQVERPGVSLLTKMGKDPSRDDVVYSETGIWFSDQGDHFFQKQRIPYPNILQLHQVVAEDDFQIMITDKTYRETIAFAKHRSVQNSHYKLIYIPTRKGVVFELYDRIRDPQNSSNLYPLGQIGPSLRDKLFSLVKHWEEATQAGDYLLPGTLRNSDL